MSAQYFACGDDGCHTGQTMSVSEADKLSETTSPVLRAAIDAELRSILGRGVSISTLMQLSRFSHTAQELLMIRSPLAEVRRKKRQFGAGQISLGSSYGPGPSLGGYGGPGGFAMSPYQAEYGYDEGDADVDSLTQEAAQNETFGAKMTREIVSALGAMKRNTGPSVQDLIESIKQAKDAGLDGVVARLETSLDEALGNGEDPEPALPRRPRVPVPAPPTPAVDVGAVGPEPAPLVSAPAPAASQVMQ